MSKTTTKKKASARPKRRVLGAFFDLMTVAFLSASVLIFGATLLIISDPTIPLNPFPQVAIPTLFQSPSPTVTNTPTSTITLTPSPIPPTLTPTTTSTPLPTLTPSLTISPTPVVPNLNPATQGPSDRGDVTPSPDAFFDANARFAFNARTVRYEQNLRADACSWLSIAGNVTGPNGEPITDIAIEVLGSDFEFVTFSGTSDSFGASGFEIQIGTEPFEALYVVRLLGPDGIALSDNIEVLTGGTCETNIVVIEFVQIRDF